MRFEFLLIPAAIIASAPAMAENFATLKEAQAAIFPGATFTPADVTMTQGQIEYIVQQTQTVVYHSKVKAWKVSTGGWLFLDQVLGRDDLVTYAIGIDGDGAVVGIEILVCTLGYDGIRNQRWLSRFYGRRFDTIDDLSTAVGNVTGATLSAGHIIDGVRRMLTTYGTVIAPKAGTAPKAG